MPCLNQNELCINFKKAVVKVGIAKMFYNKPYLCSNI